MRTVISCIRSFNREIKYNGRVRPSEEGRVAIFICQYSIQYRTHIEFRGESSVNSRPGMVTCTPSSHSLRERFRLRGLEGRVKLCRMENGPVR